MHRLHRPDGKQTAEQTDNHASRDQQVAEAQALVEPGPQDDEQDHRTQQQASGHGIAECDGEDQDRERNQAQPVKPAAGKGWRYGQNGVQAERDGRYVEVAPEKEVVVQAIGHAEQQKDGVAADHAVLPVRGGACDEK